MVPGSTRSVHRQRKGRMARLAFTHWGQTDISFGGPEMDVHYGGLLMADPVTTTTQLNAYHPASASNAAKRTDVLRDAADIVRGSAPPPEPTTTTYPDWLDRAGRCERRIFVYLWDTGGYVKSRSLSGVAGKSYDNDAVIKRLVSSIMGPFASGGSVLSFAVDSSLKE